MPGATVSILGSYFFFQAEDGIRDLTVTGVQTCALPISRIAREAERLEALIARTLKLVRLERPAQHIDQAPVDVGDVLRTIAADVAIEAHAQGCLVQVQAQGPLPMSGDPEQIGRAHV